MTVPTDTAVAELAARLTKAQKEMLVSGITGSRKVCDRLEELGLYIGERGAVRLKGASASFRTIPAAWTQLGLALRAYLLEHPHD